MTLEEIEIKSGLSHISINLYEKEGLISSYKKNGITYYDKNILATLEKIKILRDLNLSLDTIKKILKLMVKRDACHIASLFSFVYFHSILFTFYS